MLVQFGNNWFEKIKKIPGKANWTVFFFSSNYFQIERACSPSTYTYLKKKCWRGERRMSMVERRLHN